MLQFRNVLAGRLRWLCRIEACPTLQPQVDKLQISSTRGSDQTRNQNVLWRLALLRHRTQHLQRQVAVGKAAGNADGRLDGRVAGEHGPVRRGERGQKLPVAMFQRAVIKLQVVP